ncbi:uncharacterized protein N7469_001445 [Penicillium citrinum]|uniref:Uncharacterized protein n=2 Tax=Penicillium TaxID=5073 RepID=A0A9W9PHK8_PENCI|nr:uncharacterized protein N7469_001445 [Penicillium citrinum]KAJ5243118.1 hypothetical protein N7469_001445 [Penicillium citrinum]KAJ5599383.1 hypothetical protein N7450_000450 [Penicillium hetheringtonii]
MVKVAKAGCNGMNGESGIRYDSDCLRTQYLNETCGNRGAETYSQPALPKRFRLQALVTLAPAIPTLEEPWLAQMSSARAPRDDRGAIRQAPTTMIDLS